MNEFYDAIRSMDTINELAKWVTEHENVCVVFRGTTEIDNIVITMRYRPNNKPMGFETSSIENVLDEGISIPKLNEMYEALIEFSADAMEEVKKNDN